MYYEERFETIKPFTSYVIFYIIIGGTYNRRVVTIIRVTTKYLVRPVRLMSVQWFLTHYVHGCPVPRGIHLLYDIHKRLIGGTLTRWSFCLNSIPVARKLESQLPLPPWKDTRSHMSDDAVPRETWIVGVFCLCLNALWIIMANGKKKWKEKKHTTCLYCIIIIYYTIIWLPTVYIIVLHVAYEKYNIL